MHITILLIAQLYPAAVSKLRNYGKNWKYIFMFYSNHGLTWVKPCTSPVAKADTLVHSSHQSNTRSWPIQWQGQAKLSPGLAPVIRLASSNNKWYVWWQPYQEKRTIKICPIAIISHDPNIKIHFGCMVFSSFEVATAIFVSETNQLLFTKPILPTSCSFSIWFVLLLNFERRKKKKKSNGRQAERSRSNGCKNQCVDHWIRAASREEPRRE